ncbi:MULTISPECIES: LacI family DNA-binding transcriptional regulator [Sphingobium]|uniref:LacI family DNA-binding transcriptional regulator n=1 Tax=Sphingobium TaxID=165695 RepID=UPI0015EB28AA|nr:MULTISPECIES: LacI family DNA-binding transcriptional regulator [Sphingobium]MCW2363133.1 LacI family gluconate utilization system Gnt-I transcriptional repressor [Sphingobium sp. B10D3B]MCW2400187.1 LacI family gluconate utilization system Gnt-I transcriptional repressor [Sphingobium sp. B10D7B]MCW2407165.1 LacI family gluconate utilization system Gnt-I transcriptional repressor [Sphingobium xanthum]
MVTLSSEGTVRRRAGATLADVARAAQVSTATVSRALNTPDLLTKETLGRVHAAIAETGYIPSLTTGTVITNRSRLIAIMAPPTPLELFDTTVRAAVAALDDGGYQTLLGIYERDATREKIVTQILSRRPGGLILIGLPISPDVRALLVESNLPIVETWETPISPIDMVAGISHHDIGIAVGNFLMRKGYQRPMIFSTDSSRGHIRRYGISRVLMEAGRPEPRSIDHSLPGTIGEGRRSFGRIWEAGERPDVIVCSSDWLAQGVLIEAAVRGVRVPDDLAVMGFGDFDFAQELEPSLTSVRIDGAKMGRQAAALMLKALSKNQRDRTKAARVDIGFTLVERRST